MCVYINNIIYHSSSTACCNNLLSKHRSNINKKVNKLICNKMEITDSFIILCQEIFWVIHFSLLIKNVIAYCLFLISLYVFTLLLWLLRLVNGHLPFMSSLQMIHWIFCFYLALRLLTSSTRFVTSTHSRTLMHARSWPAHQKRYSTS